ncbi:hypothetical protein BC828DRAFT_440343 [Blastocladiella britannica]|nr:hypothetical protein BC828DRAFT_440343 [Blastocladiella britannica]
MMYSSSTTQRPTSIPPIPSLTEVLWGSSAPAAPAPAPSAPATAEMRQQPPYPVRSGLSEQSLAAAAAAPRSGGGGPAARPSLWDLVTGTGDTSSFSQQPLYQQQSSSATQEQQQQQQQQLQQEFMSPSQLMFEVGTTVIRISMQAFKWALYLFTTLTQTIVSNPISRPLAFLWLEAGKLLSSFLLGASRAVIDHVLSSMQPSFA